MKGSRRVSVAVGSVAVVALALWVLAGTLNSDGDVDPNSGVKNQTEFMYTVTYTLDPQEDPPDVLVIGYLNGEEQWREMMGFYVLGEIYVHYTYETTLPTAGYWGFKFQVVGGALTLMYPGPDVYNS